MGIRETLGMGSQASWTYVGDYLRDHYIKNVDWMARRDEARKRDAYHDGKGDEYIKRLIWIAFEDALTRKLRGDLVAFAKWDNVLRRVSQELATVYSQPAARRVTGDDKRYQEFLQLVKQDAVLREADKKLAYHEDVWIQYRVRKNSRTPVLDVVTPSMFWAVCDPSDQTDLMAIVLDQTPTRVTAVTPCYRVWTAEETFQLDAKCRVIVSSVEPNALKRLPGVLASVVPASAKGQLLAERPAADLVAAHESVWFQNVLLVKESKSSNKQTYVTGDTSTTADGQSADTERETILGEGVSVQAIDRGMDLTQFRDNANHMRERAAANRGIPPTVMDHAGASSGAEVHLRRLPLHELRRERILVLRAVEREIAEIQSVINDNDRGRGRQRIRGAAPPWLDQHARRDSPPQPGSAQRRRGRDGSQGQRRDRDQPRHPDEGTDRGVRFDGRQHRGCCGWRQEAVRGESGHAGQRRGRTGRR
jgi:hypothetical protein